jgi:hypothetical protein
VRWSTWCYIFWQWNCNCGLSGDTKRNRWGGICSPFRSSLQLQVICVFYLLPVNHPLYWISRTKICCELKVTHFWSYTQGVKPNCLNLTADITLISMETTLFLLVCCLFLYYVNLVLLLVTCVGAGIQRCHRHSTSAWGPQGRHCCRSGGSCILQSLCSVWFWLVPVPPGRQPQRWIQLPLRMVPSDTCHKSYSLRPQMFVFLY